MPARVLSVGSCTSDDARLHRVLASQAQVHMETAYTAHDAKNLIEQHDYTLVLVNRILDGDGTAGTDFIADIRKSGIDTPLMLVSDYAEAQATAVANGALPGFGKSDLFSPDTAERFRAILAPAAS